MNAIARQQEKISVIERGLCRIETTLHLVREEEKELLAEKQALMSEAEEWKRILEIEREILDWMAVPT